MTEFRYDPKSLRADEFINDAEILDSIAYADAHKDDIELCRRILDKSAAYQKILQSPRIDHNNRQECDAPTITGG